jgi:hypothetical protein
MTTTHAPQCTAVTQRQVFDPIDPTAMADLWIGNTEWAYAQVREIATSSDTADTVGERADRIKEFMVDQFLGEDSPILTGYGNEFFVTDLVQKAIATIDYRELVDRYSE